MQQRISLAYIHLAVLLFGLAGLFAKWVDIPASMIVFGRVFFASISLWILLYIKKERWKLSLEEYPKFVLLGLVLALHWFSFFQSIQVSSVAVGLLSFSTFTIFTSVLEPLFFKQRFSWKSMILAVLSFIGVLWIIPDFSLNNQTTIGVLWGMLSGLTFALLSILNKQYVQEYKAREVAFHQDFFATILLLPFLWLEDYTLDLVKVSKLMLLGIVFTAIAHSLFIEGMKIVKASTASIIAALEPVYGILFAFLFLAEQPNSNEVIGGSLILFVSAYASWQKY